MSQAERGLFETLCLALDFRNLPQYLRNNVRQDCKKICAEFDLAYGGVKNALEHERKYHHAAQDKIIALEQRLAEAERERDELKNIFRREDDRCFEVRMSCKDYHFLERFSIDDFKKEEFKYRVVRAAEEMKHQIFNGLTATLPGSKS